MRLAPTDIHPGRTYRRHDGTRRRVSSIVDDAGQPSGKTVVYVEAATGDAGSADLGVFAANSVSEVRR